MAKHLSRKELKQPDQFVSFWQRAWLRVQEGAAARRRPLIIGSTALVVTVAGVLAFAAYDQAQAERGSEALARVQRIATADLLLGDAPPAAADGVPRFKTDKERTEAALKELESFLSKGGGALRDEALIMKAGFLLDLGRSEEALATYGKLVDADLPKDLRLIVREGLGYAHEAKGDLEGAQAAFTKMSEQAGSAPGGFYQDRALYHRARIMQRKGNTAEAIKLYREVLDKIPGTQLRDEISGRLALLDPGK